MFSRNGQAAGGFSWKEIKAVIFDMDGVLADSEPVINEAAIGALKAYGINAREDDFLPFVGAGDTRYIAGVAEKYGLAYKPEMKALMYEIYFKILPEKLRPFPGVNEIIDAFRKKGKKTAVASAADRVKVEANLKAISMNPGRFDLILTGDEISRPKPDPEIYLKSASGLGVAPGECCVVEDALNGIIAAKKAGMKCAALATSFSEKTLETEGPDRIYGSLLELNRDITKTA